MVRDFDAACALGYGPGVAKKGIVAAGSGADILLWNPVGEVYDYGSDPEYAAPFLHLRKL
jgi:hypothetical protein